MNANINLITSYRGKITKNDSRHRNTKVIHIGSE
jgi:hypothetical protein